MARISRRQAHTRFRPPGGHHTPPDATRPQNHHCTVTAWRGTRTAKCHTPAESSLHRHRLAGTRTTRRHTPTESSMHRHRLADSVPPPGATRRHRLAHLPRVARRHRAIRVSTVPFRLAGPSLSPGATRQQWPLPLICVPSAWRLARAARHHACSALLLVSRHLNRSPRDPNHTTHQTIE